MHHQNIVFTLNMISDCYLCQGCKNIAKPGIFYQVIFPGGRQLLSYIVFIANY